MRKEQKRREQNRREEKRREQKRREEKRTEEKRTEQNRREENRREENRREEKRSHTHLYDLSLLPVTRFNVEVKDVLEYATADEGEEHQVAAQYHEADQDVRNRRYDRPRYLANVTKPLDGKISTEDSGKPKTGGCTCIRGEKRL